MANKFYPLQTDYITKLNEMDDSFDLNNYDAQAKVLTANSWAVEPEDSPVQVYTSNGDGTYSSTDATPSPQYSSLHWESKSQYNGDNVSKNELTIQTMIGELEVPNQTTLPPTTDNVIVTKGHVQSEIISHAQIGKNLFINGDMTIWERGDSITGSVRYTSDRWFCDSVNAAYTLSVNCIYAKFDGSALTSKSFSVKITTSTTDTGFIQVAQAVETINKTGSRLHTISCKIYIPSGLTLNSGATFNFSYRANSKIIRDGTHFGTVLISSLARDTWIEMSATFTMPECTTYVGVGVYLRTLGITTSGAIAAYLTDMQLELGSDATDFEIITPALQLANCQRYYEAIVPDPVTQDTVIGNAQATSTSICVLDINYTSKRVVPAISFGSQTGLQVAAANGTRSNSVSIVVRTFASINSVSVTITSGAVLVTGNASIVDLRIGSGFYIDAEL